VLIQRTMERTRRIELKLGVEPSHYQPGERRLAPRSENAELEPEADPVAGLPADGSDVVSAGGGR
jgi:hypothetical protein